MSGLRKKVNEVVDFVTSNSPELLLNAVSSQGITKKDIDDFVTSKGKGSSLKTYFYLRKLFENQAV